MKKSTVYKLLVLVILILIYFLVPTVRENLNYVVTLLATLNIVELKEYIISFGAWGPIVSILLMMFQSIAAPLPAFVITFANAYVFGWAFGAFISWTGAMLGAIMCFYITRIYGRPAAEKFASSKLLDKTDNFFDEYGNYAILIARLLPFISFDVVSYAAGLTSMGLWSFFWATGLGQLPATIVYSMLGENIDQGSKFFLGIITGVIALVALGLAIKKFASNKNANKKLT